MLRTNPLFQKEGYFFREIEWSGFLAERADNPLPIRGVDLKLNSDTTICKVKPTCRRVAARLVEVNRAWHAQAVDCWGLRGLLFSPR